MKVLVTGASGLIGSSLCPLLNTSGHTVLRLTRRKTSVSLNEIEWNPASGTLDHTLLEDLDAVIHLAGENIGGGLWTRGRKRSIRDSRITNTQLLVDTFRQLKNPPGIFLCASATGYYGSRGSELLDETSTPGGGFLAALCQDWERTAADVLSDGIRVIHLRFGIILSRNGGMLQKLLTPYRLGLGGKIGDGRQYLSWISIDDAVHAINLLLHSDDVAGAVNIVTPSPVTNEEFVRTLGTVLRRPVLFRIPANVLRMLMGEMADEMLLASTRVLPVRLQQADYQFQYSTLESALQHLLAY